jgi:hypothetical protein
VGRRKLLLAGTVGLTVAPIVLGPVFWLYAGFGVLALIFFAVKVPETKGRSPEDIERDLLGSDYPSSRDRTTTATAG